MNDDYTVNEVKEFPDWKKICYFVQPFNKAAEFRSMDEWVDTFWPMWVTDGECEFAASLGDPALMETEYKRIELEARQQIREQYAKTEQFLTEVWTSPASYYV